MTDSLARPKSKKVQKNQAPKPSTKSQVFVCVPADSK